jgi:hypothetical protein
MERRDAEEREEKMKGKKRGRKIDFFLPYFLLPFSPRLGVSALEKT